jgi:hypothetical protein
MIRRQYRSRTRSIREKRASSDAQYVCQDLDFGVPQYSYESEYGKYESEDLIHADIWWIGCEHIRRSTEELEQEESDTEQGESDISEESIRNTYRMAYLLDQEYTTETDDHVDDREREPRTPDRDDTILVCVEQ